MTSIPLLATCGLLYALAATTPAIDAADQVKAAVAVDRLAAMAQSEASVDAVNTAMRELVGRLNEHPEEINLLAEAVGPTCRKMVGL